MRMKWSRVVNTFMMHTHTSPRELNETTSPKYSINISNQRIEDRKPKENNNKKQKVYHNKTSEKLLGAPQVTLTEDRITHPLAFYENTIETQPEKYSYQFTSQTIRYIITVYKSQSELVLFVRENVERVRKIKAKFRKVIRLYSEMNSPTRPSLPKQRLGPKITELINSFNNNILSEYISAHT